MQIIDVIEPRIPGPPGEATPELLLARQQAMDAAVAAGRDAQRAQQAADSIDVSIIEQTLTQKADLVGGRVPANQVGKSQSATSGTVPERTTNGRLPGIGQPSAATDAANKAYVDLIGQEASDREQNFASVQDLIATSRITTTLSGAMDLSTPQVYSILAAPQDMRITGITLVFDQTNSISGGTNVMTARLFHRATNTDPARDIVQKTTQQEAILERYKAWSMLNGTWGAVADRVVPAGNVLDLIFTFTGTAKLVFPVTVTIQWQPVR